ncbi:MAG: DEAD/DEAH box helicase [Rubritalea sp.]|tara:strand:+ start:9881 stop:11029 length:1149 start_codon:yes stop_codon:yes gene_type:complete
MSFQSLGLHPSLIEAVASEKFSAPTPIQTQAIPAVLAGGDVMGIAKTGSGKTASYVLPLLHQFLLPEARRSKDNDGPGILVLVPTRELAQQVRAVFEQFIVALPDRIKSLAVFGGVAISPQMQALRNVDILIATPGRLIELEEKNAVKLGAVSTLVLDEADKMLNLGFKEEIDAIIALLPASDKRQNLLFSATLSDDLNAVNQLVLNSPTVIKVADADDHIDLIKQRAYLVETDRKGPFLRYLIKSEKLQQTLIFTSSAYQADHIAEKLRRNRIHAESMHGKLSQGARTERLEDFKAGKLRILVATDLLARGVDINALPCVINYELPRSPKDYIHRIGRTGRAETPGQAISLISPDERHHFKVIQKKMGQWITLEHSDEIKY